MLAEGQKDYVSLLFRGKRIEKDSIRIVRGFPYGRWGMIFWLLRHFSRNRAEIKQLTELDNYLSNIDFVRGYSRYVPPRLQKELFVAFVTRKWARLNESFILSLDTEDQMKKLLLQIKREYEITSERRARLAFLRATIEVAYLASFLVFKLKYVRELKRVKQLLLARKFDDSYEISRKIMGKMKLAYAGSIIEKGIYYVGLSIVGIIASAGVGNPSVGYWFGFLFVLGIIVLLPYFTFRRLFFE